jgi:hypothetical protein
VRPVWFSVACGGAVGLTITVTLSLLGGWNVWAMLGVFLVLYYAYAGVVLYEDRKTYEAHVPETLEAAAFRAWELMDEQEHHNPLLIAETPEQLAAMTHRTLGQWMRNNWGLWSKASKLFADIHTRYGLDHADDLSGLILIAAWHVEHSSDPSGDLDAAAKRYLSHWRDFERYSK